MCPGTLRFSSSEVSKVVKGAEFVEFRKEFLSFLKTLLVSPATQQKVPHVCVSRVHGHWTLLKMALGTASTSAFLKACVRAS